jgi:hypothetical protein
MKWRPAFTVVLMVCAAACQQPNSQSPYWAKSDKLFLEFDDVPTAQADAKAEAKALETMKRIRRDTAVLPHPEWANKYHESLVAIMEQAIANIEFANEQEKAEILFLETAAMLHRSPEADLKQLRKSRDAYYANVSPKAHQLMKDIVAERQQLAGPPMPAPMRKSLHAE